MIKNFRAFKFKKDSVKIKVSPDQVANDLVRRLLNVIVDMKDDIYSLNISAQQQFNFLVKCLVGFNVNLLISIIVKNISFQEGELQELIEEIYSHAKEETLKKLKEHKE